MRDTDFIYNGYNKFHLWTCLWYQEMTNPQNNGLSAKQIKNRALKNYLKLLGLKYNDYE